MRDAAHDLDGLARDELERDAAVRLEEGRRAAEALVGEVVREVLRGVDDRLRARRGRASAGAGLVREEHEGGVAGCGEGGGRKEDEGENKGTERTSSHACCASTTRLMWATLLRITSLSTRRLANTRRLCAYESESSSATRARRCATIEILRGRGRGRMASVSGRRAL